ncbi:hypothetical protein H4N58_13815 [Mumia sp. ZJ1417]|nr:hypothetical protein [Mumia sp. ZJ1417]QMW65276.1 hypothetical protein H4N58_13815 [Mumia sp. ZJ1417]
MVAHVIDCRGPPDDLDAQHLARVSPAAVEALEHALREALPAPENCRPEG